MSDLPPSSSLKAFLDRRLRWLYRPLRGAYHRWRDGRFWKKYRALVERVSSQLDGKVWGGPFRGMNYISVALSSALLPKLVGTYEAEVAEEVERAVARGYARVVDIGCAEGYYAVGLALRMPAVRVEAYDLEPRARALCAEVAAKNGVSERVDVRGGFSPNDLESLPAGQSYFVVCDVDGYETTLFNAATAARWADADILIEFHDILGTPCLQPVADALRNTHEVRVIDSRARTLADAPALAGLTEAERLLCVDEMRPFQQWGVFLSKRHHGGGT